MTKGHSRSRERVVHLRSGWPRWGLRSGQDFHVVLEAWRTTGQVLADPLIGGSASLGCSAIRVRSKWGGQSIRWGLAKAHQLSLTCCISHNMASRHAKRDVQVHVLLQDA